MHSKQPRNLTFELLITTFQLFHYISSHIRSRDSAFISRLSNRDKNPTIYYFFVIELWDWFGFFEIRDKCVHFWPFEGWISKFLVGWCTRITLYRFLLFKIVNLFINFFYLIQRVFLWNVKNWGKKLHPRREARRGKYFKLF